MTDLPIVEPVTYIPDEITKRANEAALNTFFAGGSGADAVLAAGRVFLEWEQKRLKASIGMRMNNYLCDMKPDYDDSITGFNEAWDIVRSVFAELEKADG